MTPDELFGLAGGFNNRERVFVDKNATENRGANPGRLIYAFLSRGKVYGVVEFENERLGLGIFPASMIRKPK